MKAFIVVILFIVSILIMVDAAKLVEICNSEYQTPWYSTNWLTQPATNMMLAINPSREYSTMNQAKTEVWHVRETKFAGKNFWTILARELVK